MIKEIRFANFVEEKPNYEVKDWIDEYGREVLDSRPVSIPLPSAPAPSSLLQLIHQLYQEQANQEHETFEDADDFDVPDEEGFDTVSTPYEQDFDHFETPAAPPAEPPAVPAEPEKVTE